MDGTTQLFFPVGDNQDRVGSALVSSPRKRHLRRSVGDHGNVTGQAHDKYVVSPSLGQPILQVIAAWPCIVQLSSKYFFFDVVKG